MKPMPTAEAAMPFLSAKTGASRSFEKPKAEAAANIRADDGKNDCEIRLHSKMPAKDADKVVERGEQPRISETFDAMVNEFDEAKPETSTVAMELASPQMSVLSSGLAALLQGIPVPSSLSTSGKPDTPNAEQSETTIGTQGIVLDPGGDTGEDMARLAEQLAARAFALNRTVVPANEGNVRTAPPEATAVKGKESVSVATLQEQTGFDASVKVTANHQKWFQSATPVQTGISNSMMRAERKLFAADMASVDKKPNALSSESGVSALSDSPIELVQPQGQPSENHASDGQSSRDGAERGRVIDAAIGASKTASGVRNAAVPENNVGVTPPYQQVRAAVAEAIVAANAAPSTDYVSLYADRPALPHLTLKTLEVSLQPPDLGRVNIKMNLAARDLKLEIEASKASTAQMLSNDQASLKRELLTDNTDLSSVMVSVTSAVSDIGAARSASNGDQHFAGNSRTQNENAFASTAGGGRDDSKQSQHSSFQENGTPRPHRDGNADDVGVNASNKALYI